MRYETKKEIGNYGELLAARYLSRRFHRILARNYRVGKYELDLISETFRDIVFTEVKTRTYQSKEEAITAAPPGHAVNSDKQIFTRRAALSYLRTHPTKKQPRMDVIEIILLRTDGKRPKVLSIRRIKAAY